jgi:hypothetical protein
METASHHHSGTQRVMMESEDDHSRSSSSEIKYGCSYYLYSSHMPWWQGLYLLQFMKHFIQNATKNKYTTTLRSSFPCIYLYISRINQQMHNVFV